ncbi:hypothetical protein FRC00_004783 [Tulasnella sp. 408]|nr:hypothetical protein FRC00_004783 [Tulasnella sp. 408]
MAEQPPNYSPVATRSSIFPPQLVIAPPADSIHFQSGNLGAEGETATVEGEVQLKGFTPDDWESVHYSEDNGNGRVTGRRVVCQDSRTLYQEEALSIHLEHRVDFSFLPSVLHTLDQRRAPGNPDSHIFGHSFPYRDFASRQSWFLSLQQDHTHPNPEIYDGQLPDLVTCGAYI